jgi:hypothetical protein
MNPYNDTIIDMLISHIKAKDQAIETLSGIIKHLGDELKDAYGVINTLKPAKKKGPPVKAVFRWEAPIHHHYFKPDRAVGMVTNDGFFEFARYLNGSKQSRTRYASVDEWMASLPSGNYTRER